MNMHYLEPSRASRTNYDSVRHDTLNFEACGRENSVAEDNAPARLAPVLHFPTATDSWITVNIHRKDTAMTDAHNAEDSTDRRGGDSDLERVARFSPSGPLNALVSTQSGDVMVRATDSNDVQVTLRATSPKFAYLLDAADVEFDPARNALTIRTLPKGISFSSKGLRIGPSRSWFDFGSSDLEVLIDVPRGSSLDISTVSGDTSLIGSLGVVTVKSVSGDVVARDTSDALDVQTASGDVHSGHVLTTLKCKSASGDVVCQGAAARTEIYSASGDVLLSADQPGKIVVRNVSGDVIVRVARGLAVDISGDTVSGSMGSNIDLNGESGSTGDDDTLLIKVTTVSGDIRIDKAS
jgi:Putative adhesin